MKRVTSIGGIFFKSKDPDKAKMWYSKHLGMNTDEYGTSFEWRHADKGEKKGFTAWGIFNSDTDYMEPSKQEYMINYRVENIEALVKELKKEGITIVDEIAEYEYGKFVHIMDCDNNKIELWEPKDEEYDKMVTVRMK